MTPIARCTRIDLDGDELPSRLHLVISADVRDRVLQDFPLWTVAGRMDLFEARPTMAEAADIARHFGHLPGNELGEAGTEFYYCVSNIANRFWDDGLNEAPSAGLVAKSAEVPR